jgi:L-fuculose-phosphate aldolase
MPKKKSSVILMERHGALLTGACREEAFRRAVLLEDICRRSIPYPYNCEKTIYSRHIPGGFILTQNGVDSVINGESNIDNNTALLHAAIYSAYPGFHYIAHHSSASVLAVMEKAKVMPAVLDDFAQIAGSDVKIERIPSTKLTKAAMQNIIKMLSKRNCVCIDGLGAVCCAGDETDCTALMAVVEKNALAFAHTRKSGKVKPLPFIDRVLMRHIYTQKYSKMRDR